MFGLGFILGPVIGGLLGAHRPAPAVLRRRQPGAASTCSTAGSCCPSRCRAERRRPFDWRTALNPVARCAELAQLERRRRAGRRRRLRGAGAVHPLHDAGCCTRPSSSAGGRCRTAGRCSPSASCRRWSQGLLLGRLLKRFSPQRLAVVGLVSSTARLRRLRRGDRGLDDVRRHRRSTSSASPSRRRSRASSPAPPTRRTQGQTMGAVSGLHSLMAVVAPVARARRCSASSRTCRAATGASARRSTSARLLQFVGARPGLAAFQQGRAQARPTPPAAPI